MDAKMKEEFLIVDGIRTHLRRGGSGKSLLLIHGLGAPPMWQRVTGSLAGAFDTIVVDLPGFGGSDCTPQAYSATDYATYLNHLVLQLTNSTVTIVGISFGGQIAATFAFMFPARVTNLVLIASTGLQQSRWFARHDLTWKYFSWGAKRVLLKNRAAVGVAGKISYFDVDNRPVDIVDRFLEPLSEPGKADAWLNAMRIALSPHEDFRERLAMIQVPTLLVWGAEDRLVPPRYAYEFQQRISGSQLEIFSECGHSLPLEKPVELCNSLQRFIR